MDGGKRVPLLEPSGVRAIALPVGLNEVSAWMCQLLADAEERGVKIAAVTSHQRHIVICKLGSGFAGCDLARQLCPVFYIIDYDGKSAAVGAGNRAECGDVLIDHKKGNVLASAELTSGYLESKADAFLLVACDKIRRIESMLCHVSYLSVRKTTLHM